MSHSITITKNDHFIKIPSRGRATGSVVFLTTKTSRMTDDTGSYNIQQVVY